MAGVSLAGVCLLDDAMLLADGTFLAHGILVTDGMLSRLGLARRASLRESEILLNAADARTPEDRVRGAGFRAEVFVGSAEDPVSVDCKSLSANFFFMSRGYVRSNAFVFILLTGVVILSLLVRRGLIGVVLTARRIAVGLTE